MNAIGQQGVHPVADLFPMMSDDELADLAADIKASGLIHPIVLDADGAIVDGRNRLRACEMAGVEPRYEPLNGRDARAYIVSANIARRNLSKGQQAMALAMIYPEPEKGGRGKKSEAGKVLENSGFSRQLLDQARTILRYSVELAEDVLVRGTHFDVALRQVREGEQKRKSHDVQMAELRAKAPDVAALIDDGRLTIEAGLAELQQRQQRIIQCIDAARASASRFLGLAAHLTVIKTAANLSDAEIAIIGRERSEIDPLSELSDKEVASLACAVKELTQLKARR